MSEQWHYRVGGVQHGPVSSEELKTLARSGAITASDFVWKEGLERWVSVSAVKGLLPVSPPPPPAPPEFRPPDSLNAEVLKKAASEAAATTVEAIRNGNPIAGFHLQKLVLIIASSLGILATFMPWVTLPVIGTIYGTAGDGWITLALFLPAFVLALRGSRLSPLAGWQRFAASIPAGIAGLIGIQKIVSIGNLFSHMADEAGDNPFSLAMAAAAQGNTRTHMGLHILFLSGAAIVAAVFLLARPRPSTTI